MSNLVLGLDLGPNSVGWALIEDNAENESQLLDIGVRVFPEGVDAFDTAKERSRNEDRRISRGMRRQIRRRAQRKRLLQAALVEAKLWPSDETKQAELLEVDPYELRDKGVSKRLEPLEIGRVLLHLNQRRGFLSNKKKDRGDAEVQGMLAEIKHNEELVALQGFATVGQMLADKKRTQNPADRVEDDEVRNRHLSRKQLVEEFETVWAKQAEFHPKLLTDKLRNGVVGATMEPRKSVPKHDLRRRVGANGKRLSDLEAFGLFGLIFFQRRMYWPKSVVGLCELEPKEKRCPKGDRHAERFRVLQEVNNLRYVAPEDKEEHRLSDQERRLLLDYLSDRDKATFDQIRKKLGFLESVKFNLERGKRAAIKGFVIDWMIAKTVGKEWHYRAEEERDTIVRMLLDNERDDAPILASLTSDYGFSPEKAETLLELDLPTGFGNLSLKAIDKLLPHLERGLVYQSISDPEESALHAAGYLRRDELQRRLFDKLPNLTRTRPADCKLGEIPNPVVKRALVELRKVVNSIVAKHGKPDAVHVEMAREVQMGAERRKEISARMRAREAEREKAAEAIRKMGYAARRDSVTKCMLWQEQGHECVYCGKPISQTQLFGGEVDVDHVLPYSRTLDDSQGNKVVGHVKCNHQKGNRTPYEWLAAGDPDRYAATCQRAASLLQKGMMPYGKYRKFLQKELDLDKFISRQLTDTGYITRATVEYVRLLFDKDHAVLGLKGQLTAELRWQWGLDKILEELPDSPAWAEKNDLRPGEKNRADHRHHAIDAIVVALTNRRRLHKLSVLVRRGGAKQHGEILEEPWPDFRESVVARVKGLKVSHRVERKVDGALHKELPFGPVDPAAGVWVKRKLLTSLSAGEVLNIRDTAVKQAVLSHLEHEGIEVAKSAPSRGRPKIEFVLTNGGKPSPLALGRALSTATMPFGTPIKKVRLLVKNATIRKIRVNKSLTLRNPTVIAYVEPDELHHVALFTWRVNDKQQYDGVYVTKIEALERVRSKLEIVRRTHPDIPEARFLFSLCTGDTVQAKDQDSDAAKLMVVSTLVSTQKRVHLVDANDARRSSAKTDIGLTPRSLLEKYRVRKVTVDPLGRVRWAND